MTQIHIQRNSLKDIAEGTDKSGTATTNGSAYNSGVSGQGTSIYVSKTQRKKKPKTSMSFLQHYL